MQGFPVGYQVGALRPYQRLTTIQQPTAKIVRFRGRQTAEAHLPGQGQKTDGPVYPFQDLKAFTPSPAALKAARTTRHALSDIGLQSLTPDDPLNQAYQVLHPRIFGVAVYGSNKVRPGSSEYDAFEKLGQLLAEARIGSFSLHVVTGGGPGAMEAAAKGAVSVPGGHAVGSGRHFADQKFTTEVHPEFYAHPDMRARMYGPGGYMDRAGLTIIGPGGIGTTQEIINTAMTLLLNEFEEPLQKQIVLLDVDGYFSKPKGFLSYMNYMVKAGMMNPGVMDLFTVVKTPEEAVAAVMNPDVPWTAGTRQKLRVLA